MKALILFLIFLWLGIQPFYANDGNTSSTTTTIKSDKKKIPLIPKYKDDSATYSLLFPTVYAYLYNEVVSVDLSIGYNNKFTL